MHSQANFEALYSDFGVFLFGMYINLISPM